MAVGTPYSGDESSPTDPAASKRLLARHLAGHGDEGAHGVGQALHPLQVVVDELGRRHVPGADRRTLLERGQVVQLGHRATRPVAYQAEAASSNGGGGRISAQALRRASRPASSRLAA